VNTATQSKSSGKQRAMAIDSSESSESITNDEDPDVLLTSRPISPSMSEVSVPQAELPLTDYASSSMGNIVEPSDVSESSAVHSPNLDHGLADGSVTVPRVQSPDVNELSTSQRSKRVRIQRDIGVQGDGGCSEDGCDDPTDARLMVQCAGPGCGLMVSHITIDISQLTILIQYHLSCCGLMSVPVGGWFCDDVCKESAGFTVRAPKRARRV
jgi:hypothetical protein